MPGNMYVKFEARSFNYNN